MDRKTVISTTALVALGAVGGLLWKKLETSRLEPQPAPAAQEASGEAAGPAATLQPGAPTQGAMSGVAAVPGTAGALAASPPVSAEVLQKRAVARARLVDLYPTLASELHLSDEEAAGFFDLLARQQVELAGLEGRGNADLRRRLEAAAEAEQGAMLGEKYQDWQQYQETEMGRDPVDRMQLILGNKGNGLGTEEVNHMIDALVAEQKRITRELIEASRSKGRDEREVLELQLQRAATNNRRMAEVASRHLDAQQLQVYELVLQEQVRGLRRKLEALDAADE